MVSETMHDFNLVYKKEEDYIRLGAQNYRNRYYSHYWGLNKNNKEEFENKVREVCKKYIEGLVWNSQYYFKTIHDFHWFYPYFKAPLAQDIYNYLTTIKLSEINFEKTEPPRPILQLLMVLPPRSAHLLPSKISHLLTSSNSDIIEYYPTDFEVDMINNFYYHECVPYLPIIDYNYLQENYSQYKLSSKDTQRNLFHKEQLVNK